MMRPLLRLASIALALIVVGTLLAALFFRMAPIDPTAWHIDPLTVEAPASENYLLLRPGDDEAPAPVFQAAPAEVAAALRDVALAMPRTALVTESSDRLHMTFVVRSRVMGFPDFFTVKILPVDEGATLAIFSRSQYGYSDFGVNEARAESWLAALRMRLAQ